jgi:hypothetical protein
MTLQQDEENPRLPRPDSVVASPERPSGCLGLITVLVVFLLVAAALATVGIWIARA